MGKDHEQQVGKGQRKEELRMVRGVRQNNYRRQKADEMTFSHGNLRNRGQISPHIRKKTIKKSAPSPGASITIIIRPLYASTNHS
jgi:hypothetical protein